MGQSTFPVPSSGSSTSTILPVNASSVILDGSLTTAGTYTTTVNGNGGIAYLVATDNPAIFTVGSNIYPVIANSVSGTTTTIGSSASVTITAGVSAPSSTTATNINSSSYSNYSIAYGNGVFIIPQTGTTIATGRYSTNGTTWSNMTFPASRVWNVVIYGLIGGTGYFVALSNNNASAAYSTNGTTWTASTTTSGQWISGAYGNGTFVVVPSGSQSTAKYSTNGTSWTSSTLPSTGVWCYVTYWNGYFIAVSNSTTPAIAYSLDGITWTSSSSTFQVGYYQGTPSIATTGQTWVGFNYALNNTTGYYTTTPLGSWNTMVMPFSGNWYACAAVGQYFVAFANPSTNVGAYSTNGTTWIQFTSNWSNTPQLGQYVVVGNTLYFTSNSSVYTGLYTMTLSSTLPVNFGIYNGPTTIN